MLCCIAIAHHYKFFNIPEERKASLNLNLVILAFSIFLFCNLFLNPLIVKMIFYQKEISETLKISVLSLLNGFGISLLLFLYFLKKERSLFFSLIKESKNSIFHDIKTGLFTWPLAFSSVLFISNLLESIIFWIFDIKEIPDQLAVGYVKASFHNPWYLIIALLNVILFAPLLEEFLFRGVLQTYLKKIFNRTSSILLTSLCFALFHYVSSQGYSNIVIIGALIIFSSFLGFLYEKERSLISCFVLHSAFNTISIVNLLIFQS